MKNKKLVMIPGPTPVTRSIMDQMGRETCSFKDHGFVEDFKGLIDDLKAMWKAEACFVISGTGTLAMEIAVANSAKAGDRALVISHGYFGDRYVDLIKRRGIEVDVLASEWGKTVPLSEIQKALKEKSYQIVTATHVDTSTGVRADVNAIGEILKAYPDTIFIVDGVCASAAEKEQIADTGIDIIFTASQKAFGVSPGLAIVWASKAALQRRQDMVSIRDSYLDFEKWLPIMNNPMKYYGTPPINMIWALKESVRLIAEEGLEARYERHTKDAQAMQQAIELLGFKILAERGCRAVSLSNVIYPEGINDAEFRKVLEEEGVVAAGGLGAYTGKLFRLGHMGNIDKHTIYSTMAAIERALIKVGYNYEVGIGLKTLLQYEMINNQI